MCSVTQTLDHACNTTVFGIAKMLCIILTIDVFVSSWGKENLVVQSYLCYFFTIDSSVISKFRFFSQVVITSIHINGNLLLIGSHEKEKVHMQWITTLCLLSVCFFVGYMQMYLKFMFSLSKIWLVTLTGSTSCAIQDCDS